MFKVQQTPESARLKVDGILKARGLGRSTEDLLKATDEKPVEDSSEVAIEPCDETSKSAETFEESSETVEIANIKDAADVLENATTTDKEVEEEKITDNEHVDDTPVKHSDNVVDDTETLNLQAVQDVEKNASVTQAEEEVSSTIEEPVEAWSEKVTEERDEKPEDVLIKVEDEKTDIDIPSSDDVDIQSSDLNESNKINGEQTLDNDLNKHVTNSNNNVVLANGESTEVSSF